MSIFAPLGNTNVTRGHGIQNDLLSSNVTVNCDPRLTVPDTAANVRNGLVKPEIAGKIAVEHDICDLDVRNLTVNGTLIVPGNTILSCTVIEEDGAICCPLTVRNTNVPTPPATGQTGHALCVEGSTVMQPITDPATSEAGEALLFLDGTSGSGLITGDYLRIDARPLRSGVGLGIDLASSTTAMTGKGIQILKGGSNMQSTGRLLSVTASDEKGLAPDYADIVILSEVLGPKLSDPLVTGAITGPGQPGGINQDSRTQTALLVDAWNTDGTYAPVAGLQVQGGTTFIGVGDEKNHGHIHADQADPPKPLLVSENGTALTQTADLFAVYPDTSDPSIFSDPTTGLPRRGTDIAGVIFISNTGQANAFLWVPFSTPFPNNCYPSIQLSCDVTFYDTIGSAGTGSPAMILQNFQDPTQNPAAPIANGFFQDVDYLANKGFIIPLSGIGKGHVHYQVMGVLGGR